MNTTMTSPETHINNIYSTSNDSNQPNSPLLIIKSSKSSDELSNFQISRKLSKKQSNWTNSKRRSSTGKKYLVEDQAVCIHRVFNYIDVFQPQVPWRFRRRTQKFYENEPEFPEPDLNAAAPPLERWSSCFSSSSPSSINPILAAT